MTTTDVTDLEAKLSEYLARVRAGDEVVVTDRGTPIARIVPLTTAGADGEELERADLLRRPVRRLGDDFWARRRPADRDGAVRAALAAERAPSATPGAGSAPP